MNFLGIGGGSKAADPAQQAQPIAEQLGNGGEASSQSPTAVQMKTGDYMIHVFIMIGKNFKLADNVTIDPLIEVETCGIKKYTSCKDQVPCKSTANQSWREHLFFEPRAVHSSKIELETISIRVKNKGVFKDELVGMYEFDMTKVYFEKQHAIQNQWVALFNPDSSDFAEISGNLKISISVQGPGDEQVQLSENTGPEDPNQGVMMPAQIKKEFKQLKIRFIQATDLPDLDYLGTIDAYICTTFMGKKLVTKPVKGKDNIAPIEQEFWLPIQWPMASDRLVLELKDDDGNLKAHDMVGSMFFSLKKLIELGRQEGGHYYWQNMYGSPVGYENGAGDLMNKNPEIGSSWKGRILMQVESEESKHPERREQALESSIKATAVSRKLFEKRAYDVIAEIGQGVSLPKNSQKYKIKIQIGDFEINSSDPKESKPGYNRWSERFNQQKLMTVYQSIEEMDKIFVYLMDGTKPICFWKGSVSDFKDPNPKYRWLTMKTDKAIGSVENDYEAGLLQFKFSINDVARNNNASIDYKQYDAWSKAPPRRLGSKKIRCCIFQCRDIPSADADGGSDAFISLWNPDNKEDLKTRVIEDSLNPIFYETLDMLYDMNDIDTAPPIIMNIWDKDQNLISDSFDFLGRCTVFLQDASTNLNKEGVTVAQDNNKIPQPKWHDIKMDFEESTPACGQVLCSFVVVGDDFDFQTPSKYMRLADIIPMKEYTVEINVLGLRNLESFGLMPIKKPFIKFSIKSLLPPEKAQAVTNICTDPNAPGENPNINTTINFSVLLPKEALYCPSLGCDIYDYVFSGFSQPLIGTMNIPIGDKKTKTEEKSKKMLILMDSIIKDLETKNQQSSTILKQKSVSRRSGGGILLSSEDKNKKVGKGKIGQEDVIGPAAQADGYQQMFDQEIEEEKDENALLLDQRQSALQDEFEIGNLNLAPDNSGMKGLKDAQQEVKKILQELDQYKVDIEKKGAKESQADIANKNSLRRRLLEQRKRFQDEKKKALAVQKKLDAAEMKTQGVENAFAMIICPQYHKNDELQIYIEDAAPPSTVFKSVGYNNLEVVKKMMEGDDAEKRSGFKLDQKRAGTQQQVPDSSRRRMEFEHKEALIKEGQRRLDITKKHYRKFYDDELENDSELFHEKPFDQIDIYRGQSRGLKKSWWNIFGTQQIDESGQATDKKKVGYFKGRIFVYNEEERQKYQVIKDEKMKQIFALIRNMHFKLYDQQMDISMEDVISSHEASEKFKHLCVEMDINMPKLIHFIQDEASKTIVRQQLLTQTAASIQLYILEGYDFAGRDIGSPSDPYLIIKLGKEEKNDRANYQLDEPNPKFHKYFEFKGSFPGMPPLVIEAWDYDDLFGDDLIGSTSIDLDDRFFSGDWQALDEKPIEYRQLYHQSTSLSQGVITGWLEIEPQSKGKKSKEQKIWDITPEPKLDYEVRVCVMDAKNIPLEDIEGTSDVFFKCYIDDKDKKMTDTHYRCQSGEASFNYRLLFNVQAPRDPDQYELVLQAWDFDLFKSNDYICEWVFNLTEIMKNVRLTQQPVFMNKKYYDLMLKKTESMRDQKIEFQEDDTFWLTTMKDGKAIKVRLDIRVFPAALAATQKLGEARNEPNMEPHLPPPIGRISFSLNPFTMLAQLVNKEYLNKLYALICVLICCACLIAMAPMILSNLVSQIMFKIFGLS